MMNDDEGDEQCSAHLNTQRVGRRLAIIREELGKHDGEQNWSQTAVGNRVGLTQNVITRIELGKGGLIENWLKVLNLYESLGYNLNWIMSENNTIISKYVIQEKTNGRLRDGLLESLDRIDSSWKNELAQLRGMVLAVPEAEKPEPTAAVERKELELLPAGFVEGG